MLAILLGDRLNKSVSARFSTRFSVWLGAAAVFLASLVRPVEAEENAVEVHGGLTQEILGVVSGGLQRTGEYNLLVSASISADLGQLLGWSGAIFSASGYAVGGSSLSAAAIGDSSNVSNINFRNSVRLFECYLDQTLADGKFSIRIGQLAADSEFFGSEAGPAPGGGIFINSDFGAIPIASFNAPLPIYAIAAPGLRLRFAPNASGYFQAAVYDGNPAPDLLGDPSPGFTSGSHYNDHGFDLHLASSEGAVIVAEAATVVNLGGREEGNELPGSYKLGGFYHTDDFTRWSDGAAVRGNWAIYAIASQKVWSGCAPGPGGLFFFVRAGKSPKDRAVLDWAVDGGLNYLGLFPGRTADILGVGCSHKHYSREFSQAASTADGEAPGAETIFEITYQIQIAPWCSLQPDWQYVRHPSGLGRLSDATVAGLRLNLTF